MKKKTARWPVVLKSRLFDPEIHCFAAGPMAVFGGAF